MKTKENVYNQSLTVANLTREEVLNPAEYNLLCYSKPSDISEEGLPVGKLGNQADGFPFTTLGHEWKGSEFLYLCGRWSLKEQANIQHEIDIQACGNHARRFPYYKHFKEMRKDFDIFKHHWMLWVVWQKCIGNEDFRNLLLSMPSDRIICEVEKRDPVWALIKKEDGMLHGCNAMGKILTLCKRALETNTTPEIDYKLLNQSDIYIFGEKIDFLPKTSEAEKHIHRPNLKYILRDLFLGVPPCWQEKVGLCIANKKTILHNARMYNTELPLSFVAFQGRPKRYLTLGQWLEIWDQVLCTKQVCPRCGKTMYLYRLTVGGTTTQDAEYFCPDCRSIYPLFLRGEIIRLVETLYRYPNHLPLPNVPVPIDTEDRAALEAFYESRPFTFINTLRYLVAAQIPPTTLEDIPPEPIVQPEITTRMRF